MTGAIFILDSEDHLIELNERAYDSESLLQQLLASHPSLLAGDQIDPTNPRKWLLVTRETAVPSEQDGSGRWFIDHLFLDQDAVPTLVEVKRSSDSRIRREVVGQMLDYAANAVVYWPVETLQATFEGRCSREGAEPAELLRDFLGPDEDPARFWHRVKTNLQAGRVRLVFVADVIPAELRRVVEFLNTQMDPAEVLALEVRQYVGQSGVRTLVPRVIGRTEQAQQRKAPAASGLQWDEASFFEALQSKAPAEDVAVARALYDWGKLAGNRIWFGKGAKDGSATPVLDHAGMGYFPIILWTYGMVEFQFQALQTRPPFDRLELRRELQARLNRIPGISIPDDRLTKRPSVRLAALRAPDSLAQLIDVLNWVFTTAKVGGNDAGRGS